MTDAIFTVVAAALIGGLGGFINYAQRFTGDKGPPPPWESRIAALKFFIGAFVGILTLWAVEDTVRKSNYIFLAAAITGYGGPLTLDFLFELSKTIAQAWAGKILGGRAPGKDQDNEPKN